MQNKTQRIALIAFFVALLATPFVIRKLSARGGVNGASGDPATALARYGFRFEEVARKSGIAFVHKAPVLDSKLSHIMDHVASMGAAVSVVDFDKDGWQDLFVTNSGETSKNALYRNTRDGKFVDVAAKMGLADLNSPETGVSMGATWADYDNDGFEDVIVYKWGRPELFHNEAGKSFRRVTEGSGLPQWVNANSAIWLDYDRDGKVDLFLAGYFDERLNLWSLKNTAMMPESFEYAQNGGRKYLLKNLGGGVFEDVTDQLGIKSRRWALAAIAADLRGTGYPDIFIANDYGVSELFLNEGGRRFREVGKESGVGFAPKSGMNASFGDVLNTGRFCIYVSNISEEGILIQGNNLWVPREGSPPGELKYDNMASDMRVELGGWSFGAQFGDLNNDGNQDLYLVNGYISSDKNRDYWYDFSKIAGGNSYIISDARRWPPLDGRSLSGFQPKKVWINDGKGWFTDVAQEVGVSDRYDGRSIALADFWNRGALDAVVANQKGPLLLYKNSAAPDNQWIAFDLEGTKSNRSSIGAMITVYFDGKRQLQQVSGGSGFCAQNQRRVHFGLGKSRPEKAVIQWPSGKVQEIASPEPGKVHKLKEPA